MPRFCVLFGNPTNRFIFVVVVEREKYECPPKIPKSLNWIFPVAPPGLPLLEIVLQPKSPVVPV